MNEEYPIDCECCGEQILDEEEDFANMCSECYDTPPKDLSTPANTSETGKRK